MSMLAERKQKQRWSLNPRGKNWSEDSNKFGQKMLERMGWKHGKGLGANEDGNTEHVKVSYKNDSKGMGFKENTEQWTEHDDKFSGLLKALNGDSNDTNDNLKLNSLHEIAETTKTRINYHKFTKGKDLSRYSEKDLANIFGKKSLTSKPQPKEIVEEKKASVIVESENLVERGSMTDYFKKKIPNFGRNSFGLKVGRNGVLTRDSDSESERPAFGFGFKTEEEPNKPKGKKRKYEDCFTEDSPAPHKLEEIEELPKVSTKKSKKKKTSESFVSYLNNVGNSDEPVKLEDKVILDEPKEKKKKKKTKIVTEETVKEEVEETPSKSKKKFKKSKQNGDIGDIEDIVAAPSNEENENTPSSGNPVQKKKKSKKQETEETSKDLPDNSNIAEEGTPKTKKKKSKKHPEESGGFSNEAFDPMYKSPPKIGKLVEEGISNPAFDPLYNNVKVEKHILNVIEETNEDCVDREMEEKPIEIIEAHPQTEGKKKRKKNKEPGDEIDQIEEVVDGETKKPKKKKKKSQDETIKLEEGGILNPCFDENAASVDNEPKPAQPEEIQCDLMLNVFSAPPQPKRRKSVRFSDTNEERIIPNNYMRERNDLFDINNEVINKGLEDDIKNNGNTAEHGFINNGFDIHSIDNASFYDETPNASADGTDNAAFDRRAANLEEKVKTMSKTIENCEAEVDNDINESRSVSNARGQNYNNANFHGRPSHFNDHHNQHNDWNGRGRPFMRPYARGRGGFDHGGPSQLTMTVGESGPFAKYHQQVKGGVRLSFRHANILNKNPPWMRRPGGNLAKQGYKHLIKGDIIVNFDGSNVHTIKGYAVQSGG